MQLSSAFDIHFENALSSKCQFHLKNTSSLESFTKKSPFAEDNQSPQSSPLGLSGNQHLPRLLSHYKPIKWLLPQFYSTRGIIYLPRTRERFITSITALPMSFLKNKPWINLRLKFKWHPIPNYSINYIPEMSLLAPSSLFLSWFSLPLPSSLFPS